MFVCFVSEFHRMITGTESIFNTREPTLLSTVSNGQIARPGTQQQPQQPQQQQQQQTPSSSHSCRST